MSTQTLRQRSALRESERWKRAYNRRQPLDCGHTAGNYPIVHKDGRTFCCEACSQCAMQQDQHLAHVARLAR